jgi:hypothetical protein
MDGDEEDGDNYQPDRIRQYPMNYIGRFEVFIRQAKIPLKHLEISKKINENFPNSVQSLVKVNPYKIRVEFKNIASANALPECDFLEDYRVYIPAKSVEINGLISISTDTSTDEIVSEASGKFFGVNSDRVRVLDAYRFSKTVEKADGSSEKINTPLMRVTFEGTVLPKWLVIHGLLIRVSIHTPKIMHCGNCLGYGHTTKFCTAKPVCTKCGGHHLSSSCESTSVICTHCKVQTDHSYKTCPVYIAHYKQIKNQTITTARKNLPTQQTHHANPYEILSQTNEPPNGSMFDENFVQQPNRKRPRKERPSKPSKNQTSSANIPSSVPFNFNQPSTSGTSYAQATKRPANNNNGQPIPSPVSAETQPPSQSHHKRKRRERSEPGTEEPNQSQNQSPPDPPPINPEQRDIFIEAIISFIASKQLHPILSNLIIFITTAIIDWIWPMISPFSSFLLSFFSKNQNE